MKKGDKVNVIDESYGFGVYDGEFCRYLNNKDGSRENLTVVETGLSCMENSEGDRVGVYSQVNDLLVTDGQGNFWFTQSRFCELVNKEITVRYFCNDKDVTDNISDETKRNLHGV